MRKYFFFVFSPFSLHTKQKKVPIENVDVTGGCRNAKASARGLTLASGFGARDGGLTILRTCNRPDVVVTMVRNFSLLCPILFLLLTDL